MDNETNKTIPTYIILIPAQVQGGPALELVKKLSTETELAMDWSMAVIKGVIGILALATLVAFFLKKL